MAVVALRRAGAHEGRRPRARAAADVAHRPGAHRLLSGIGLGGLSRLSRGCPGGRRGAVRARVGLGGGRGRGDGGGCSRATPPVRRRRLGGRTVNTLKDGGFPSGP